MRRIGKTLRQVGLTRRAIFAEVAVLIIGAMSDTSHAERPPTIDPIASARWAAWPHAQSPWLNEEVGRRMEDRLQWIRMQPKTWLDWAPVSGGLQTHRLLQTRYPKARCHVVEATSARAQVARRTLQLPWWKQLFLSSTLSFEAPAPASVDMVWANMALHTSDDPDALLRTWHQVLAVDGFLMFSCLGPDTLRELAEAYQKLGWPPASHAFTDMHDWGDMLVQAGFAEPVMDMERITLSYADAESLLAECRLLGRNLHQKRFAGLRGKLWLARLKTALLSLARADQNGRLTLTVEVIYGHALKPLPRLKVQSESSVSLGEMRAILGKTLSRRSV